MRVAEENAAALASKSNDGEKIACSRDRRPRLAADVVGTAARSHGPLAAGYRNRPHCPWPGTGGAMEWADQRRAHLLRRATHVAGGSHHARTDAAPRCLVPPCRAAA